jgi:hypothetical protein
MLVLVLVLEATPKRSAVGVSDRIAESGVKNSFGDTTALVFVAQ